MCVKEAAMKHFTNEEMIDIRVSQIGGGRRHKINKYTIHVDTRQSHH